MFRKGQPVLIGGKEAADHSYTSIVGEVGVYVRAEDDTHVVRVKKHTWYVSEEDVISIEDNASVLALLHQDSLFNETY